MSVHIDTEESVMNTGGRIAAGLAAGYAFGRFRKLRWALAVAAYVAGKRVGEGGGGLQSTLTANPLVKGLTSQLTDAGKSAATAIASRRIEAASSRMESMASSMRTPRGEEDSGRDDDSGGDASGHDDSGTARRARSGDEATTRRRNGDRGGRRTPDAADQEPASSGPQRRERADGSRRATGTDGEPAKRSTTAKPRSSSRAASSTTSTGRRASGRSGSSARKG